MLQTILEYFLHLDVHLAELTLAYGPWIYLILFLIIFCETGLIFMPFLPGDSLLFAVGALASIPSSGIDVMTVWCLLVFAAVLGDNVNYQVGQAVGPKIFTRPKSLLFNPKHLVSTQRFYVDYGARAVIFARFMPIFRTFAPFVAGVARMPLKKYILFSCLGSLLWMSSFIGAGFFFGNIPKIKSNFHYVIVAVILVSFLPLLIAAIRKPSQSPS
ncbi:MAG: DedA family protein [Bdellovibrionota bacterium]